MSSEEQNRAIERFIGFLPTGVIVFDDAMNFKFWNDKGLDLLGIGVEKILVDPVSSILDASLFTFVSHGLSAAAGDLQSMIIEKGSRLLNCQMRCVPVADGKELIVIVEDVSKLREIERIQQDFISNILHKLRGPLSTVKTSLAMLQDERVIANIDQTREILAMGYHEVDRLVCLSTNIRDMFLLETHLAEKELEFEDFPIVKAVTRSIDEIEKMPEPFTAIRKMVTVDSDGPALVRADFEKTKMIFSALLKNAHMYSDGTENIKVRIVGTDQEVFIRIIDHGIGFTQEDIPRIFEKYFRADTPFTRKYDGNGLGLYLARAYLSLMNGTITCESAAGVGSVFTVSLPASRSN